MAQSEYEFQTIVRRFAEASHIFSLTISLSKPRVMCQSAPQSIATHPSINIGGIHPELANNFKYLGSIIFPGGTLNKEIEAHQAGNQDQDLQSSITYNSPA